MKGLCFIVIYRHFKLCMSPPGMSVVGRGIIVSPVLSAAFKIAILNLKSGFFTRGLRKCQQCEIVDFQTKTVFWR